MKGETQFRSNHTLELFLDLAWPKKLSNNPQRTSAASTTKKRPKTRVNRQPKFTMKTMATLHSPKTGEKSDSQSWAKGGHKRRPQSDEETKRTLHSPSWGRRKTPSIDKGKLSQRMWKSVVAQHPRAHSTQFLNAIAKEICINKNGERTDSPSICA